MYFVDHCHQNGIGVLVDWVPAHFPRDGMACGCSTARTSTSMPTRGRASIRDWGTLIFNYGRNEVRNFLVSNALFWIDKYHIDGLRRRRRGLDDLSGLQPQGGRVDAQRIRRTGKPARRSRSSRS